MSLFQRSSPLQKKTPELGGLLTFSKGVLSAPRINDKGSVVAPPTDAAQTKLDIADAALANARSNMNKLASQGRFVEASRAKILFDQARVARDRAHESLTAETLRMKSLVISAEGDEPDVDMADATAPATAPDAADPAASALPAKPAKPKAPPTETALAKTAAKEAAKQYDDAVKNRELVQELVDVVRSMGVDPAVPGWFDVFVTKKSQMSNTLEVEKQAFYILKRPDLVSSKDNKVPKNKHAAIRKEFASEYAEKFAKRDEIEKLLESRMTNIANPEEELRRVLVDGLRLWDAEIQLKLEKKQAADAKVASLDKAAAEKKREAAEKKEKAATNAKAAKQMADEAVAAVQTALDKKDAAAAEAALKKAIEDGAFSKDSKQAKELRPKINELKAAESAAAAEDEAKKTQAVRDAAVVVLEGELAKGVKEAEEALKEAIDRGDITRLGKEANAFREKIKQKKAANAAARNAAAKESKEEADRLKKIGLGDKSNEVAPNPEEAERQLKLSEDARTITSSDARDVRAAMKAAAAAATAAGQKAKAEAVRREQFNGWFPEATNEQWGAWEKEQADQQEEERVAKAAKAHPTWELEKGNAYAAARAVRIAMKDTPNLLGEWETLKTTKEVEWKLLKSELALLGKQLAKARSGKADSYAAILDKLTERQKEITTRMTELFPKRTVEEKDPLEAFRKRYPGATEEDWVELENEKAALEAERRTFMKADPYRRDGDWKMEKWIKWLADDEVRSQKGGKAFPREKWEAAKKVNEYDGEPTDPPTFRNKLQHEVDYEEHLLLEKWSSTNDVEVAKKEKALKAMREGQMENGMSDADLDVETNKVQWYKDAVGKWNEYIEARLGEIEFGYEEIKKIRDAEEAERKRVEAEKKRERDAAAAAEAARLKALDAPRKKALALANRRARDRNNAAAKRAAKDAAKAAKASGDQAKKAARKKTAAKVVNKLSGSAGKSLDLAVAFAVLDSEAERLQNLYDKKMADQGKGGVVDCTKEDYPWMEEEDEYPPEQPRTKRSTAEGARVEDQVEGERAVYWPIFQERLSKAQLNLLFLTEEQAFPYGINRKTDEATGEEVIEEEKEEDLLAEGEEGEEGAGDAVMEESDKPESSGPTPRDQDPMVESWAGGVAPIGAGGEEGVDSAASPPKKAPKKKRTLSASVKKKRDALLAKLEDDDVYAADVLIFNTCYARRLLREHLTSLKEEHQYMLVKRDNEGDPVYKFNSNGELNTLYDDAEPINSSALYVDLASALGAITVEDRVLDDDGRPAEIDPDKLEKAVNQLLPFFENMLRYRNTILKVKEMEILQDIKLIELTQPSRVAQLERELKSIQEEGVAAVWGEVSARRMLQSERGQLPGQLFVPQPTFLPLRVAAPPRVGKSACALLVASLAKRIGMTALYSVSPNKTTPIAEMSKKLHRIGWRSIEKAKKADDKLKKSPATESLGTQRVELKCTRSTFNWHSIDNVPLSGGDCTPDNEKIDMVLYSSDVAGDVQKVGSLLAKWRRQNMVVFHLRDEAQSLAKAERNEIVSCHTEFVPPRLTMQYLRYYFGNLYGLNCNVTATHFPTLLEEDMWGFFGSTGQNIRAGLKVDVSWQDTAKTLGAGYLPNVVPALRPKIPEGYIGVGEVDAWTYPRDYEEKLDTVDGVVQQWGVAGKKQDRVLFSAKKKGQVAELQLGASHSGLSVDGSTTPAELASNIAQKKQNKKAAAKSAAQLTAKQKKQAKKNEEDLEELEKKNISQLGMTADDILAEQAREAQEDSKDADYNPLTGKKLTEEEKLKAKEDKARFVREDKRAIEAHFGEWLEKAAEGTINSFRDDAEDKTRKSDDESRLVPMYIGALNANVSDDAMVSFIRSFGVLAHNRTKAKRAERGANSDAANCGVAFCLFQSVFDTKEKVRDRGKIKFSSEDDELDQEDGIEEGAGFRACDGATEEPEMSLLCCVYNPDHQRNRELPAADKKKNADAPGGWELSPAAQRKLKDLEAKAQEYVEYEKLTDNQKQNKNLADQKKKAMIKAYSDYWDYQHQVDCEAENAIPTFYCFLAPNAEVAIEAVWREFQIPKIAIMGYGMLQAGLTVQSVIKSPKNHSLIKPRNKNGKIAPLKKGTPTYLRIYCPQYVALATASNAALDAQLQIAGRAFVELKGTPKPKGWRIKMLGVENIVSRLTNYSAMERTLAEINDGDESLKLYEALKQKFNATMMEENLEGTLGVVGVRRGDFGNILGLTAEAAARRAKAARVAKEAKEKGEDAEAAFNEFMAAEEAERRAAADAARLEGGEADDLSSIAETEDDPADEEQEQAFADSGVPSSGVGQKRSADDSEAGPSGTLPPELSGGDVTMGNEDDDEDRAKRRRTGRALLRAPLLHVALQQARGRKLAVLQKMIGWALM